MFQWKIQTLITTWGNDVTQSPMKFLADFGIKRLVLDARVVHTDTHKCVAQAIWK